MDGGGGVGVGGGDDRAPASSTAAAAASAAADGGRDESPAESSSHGCCCCCSSDDGEDVMGTGVATSSDDEVDHARYRSHGWYSATGRCRDDRCQGLLMSLLAWFVFERIDVVPDVQVVGDGTKAVDSSVARRRHANATATSSRGTDRDDVMGFCSVKVLFLSRSDY
jgi:hypothetical protein